MRKPSALSPLGGRKRDGETSLVTRADTARAADAPHFSTRAERTASMGTGAGPAAENPASVPSKTDTERSHTARRPRIAGEREDISASVRKRAGPSSRAS